MYMDHDSTYQIDEESEMHSQSSQQEYTHCETSRSALAGRCTWNIDHYLSNEPHDDQYYLEMLHRAMVNHEPDDLGTLATMLQPASERMDA